MSQPAEFQGYRPPSLQNAPSIIYLTLPLEDSVTIYHTMLETGIDQIEELIRGIPDLENPEAKKWDVKKQHGVMALARENAKNNRWDWTPINVGRYLAQGLTQTHWLARVALVPEEEVKGIKDGEEVGFALPFAFWPELIVKTAFL